MRTQRIKIRSDGRLPSGGLPFHLMDGLPRARGDLHGLSQRCRDVFCLDRDESRAGAMLNIKGPPCRRIRLPALGTNCRGSTPLKKRDCHPERSRFMTSEGSGQRVLRHPGAVFTAEGSDNCALYQILRPDKSGFRMTVALWWSPPGRNGPMGTSVIPTNFSKRNAAKTTDGMSIPQILSPAGSAQGSGPPGRNGPVGTSPPKRKKSHPERSRFMTSEGSDQRESRHPDAVFTAEGSDNYALYQILRPDKSGLRMTNSSADEKQCSVVELREEKKFSRSNCFGTPSFSLTANRTEDLFTINTFS